MKIQLKYITLILKKRNGPYNKFEGNIFIGTGVCVDGQKNGEWRTYYETGELKSINNYANGNKIGEWRTYCITGRLEMVINYADDKKNGLYEYYYMRNDMEDNIDEFDDTTQYIIRGNYLDDKKLVNGIVKRRNYHEYRKL